MKIYIVIPAYNEEGYLAQTLESLVSQSLLPEKIVVVDDSSTDKTPAIIEKYSKRYPFISGLTTSSVGDHQPGSKVVRAFNRGLESLDEHYDLICKFDADLIFPSNYLHELSKMYMVSPRIGMAGGFCAISRHGTWTVENLTAKDHLRGALKSYRRECFKEIGGLKPAMGWDTADEILARYNGWEISTNQELIVKHLKPTGISYRKSQALRQGEAFKNLRYGLFLTVLGALKLAIRKRSVAYFFGCVKGYFNTKGPHLLSRSEGRFLRRYRWRNLGRN